MKMTHVSHITSEEILCSIFLEQLNELISWNTDFRVSHNRFHQMKNLFKAQVVFMCQLKMTSNKIDMDRKI